MRRKEITKLEEYNKEEEEFKKQVLHKFKEWNSDIEITLESIRKYVRENETTLSEFIVLKILMNENKK